MRKIPLRMQLSQCGRHQQNRSRRQTATAAPKNITAQAPDEDQPVNQELLDFFDAMDEKKL